MSRTVDPSKIEPLMREILNRLGLSGTQRMISFWLKGCHPYKNDDFPCTKSSLPDYWPPGCRYVSPTKLNALESQIVSLHLLRAGLKFRDAQFNIERMEESTINVISGYPKDFYHDAPILINSLYEARRQEIKWNLKGIPKTATHVTAEILMPVPNSRKRTSIKKAIQFDLQLPDDIEGYIGQITSKESSSVAPSTTDLCSEPDVHMEGTEATATRVSASNRTVYGRTQAVEARGGTHDPSTEEQTFRRLPTVDSTRTSRGITLSPHDSTPPLAPVNAVFRGFGTQALSPNSPTDFSTAHNTVGLLNQSSTPRDQSMTFQAGASRSPWDIEGEHRPHPQDTLLMQLDGSCVDGIYAKGCNVERQASEAYSMDYIPATSPHVPTERAICANCHSDMMERSNINPATTLLCDGQQLPHGAFQNSRLGIMSHAAMPLQHWSNEAVQSSRRSGEEIPETW